MLRVSGRHVDGAIETTSAFRWFVFHQVMAVRLTTTDFTGARDREALCRAAVGLHFRHD